mmetsp:Transcript_71178/g.159305  ORF Transcript_71178/g.159305 Transcript_71178/m.159305 type:complete len:261 (-) Transcript_71178:646-1428(-)
MASARGRQEVAVGSFQAHRSVVVVHLLEQLRLAYRVLAGAYCSIALGTEVAAAHAPEGDAATAVLLHLEQLPVGDSVGSRRDKSVWLGNHVAAVGGPHRNIVLEQVAVVRKLEGLLLAGFAARGSHRVAHARALLLFLFFFLPFFLFFLDSLLFLRRRQAGGGVDRAFREGAVQVLRAVEGHVVRGVRRTEDEAHSVVVGVAIHPRAILMDSLNEVRAANRALPALLRRLRRRRTTIVLGLRVGGSVLRGLVAPIAEGEL